MIEKMNVYQHDLPSLPIPSLKSTQTKLLEWVAPLLSDEQLEKTTAAARQFFEETSEAKQLQEKLHEWDAEQMGSWLKPFWDDLYLKYRESLPTGMHFNVLLDTEQSKHQLTQWELAGKVSRFVAEYYHKIIDEDIEPATLRGMPLDMGQYKNFFRSMRVPRLERDEFRVAAFEKSDNHVVILYKGNVYQVSVTNNEGAIYSSETIAVAIEKTLRDEQEEGSHIGIFTVAKRDEAAKYYDELTASKVNAHHLQVIADALIVISIDEESENAKEAIENLMLSGHNKYYDKTIQAVITKKGKLGFSIEHSSVDGTAIFEVIRHINEGLRRTQAYEASPTSTGPICRKLTWELAPELQKSLAYLKKKHYEAKDDFYIGGETFQAFGSAAIKKMNISPDAFFHMALQIAQYRTFGVLRSVYEPVAVRHFKEGRTECARATSEEKAALVQALETGEQNADVLYELMEEASAAHAKRINDCRRGHGVERHMYGLEQMYRLYGADLGIKEIPAIFTDEGFRKMRHDFISTSGMAYDNVKYRAFAPVVEGGFGLAYILFDTSMTINISSRTAEKAQAKALEMHLIKALEELQQIGEYATR